MKKVLLFISFVILSWPVFAQNIVVERFEYVQNDLTANMAGSIVYDQNGEKCALIKVRSNPPTKDFIFDVGHLGIQEVRYDGPEIWLYVPYGVRRITIKHSELGVLDDYDLGISVKKASTYILTLRVGRIQTIIEEEIRMQYLVFNVEPKDALVMVNDEAWDLADGIGAKLLNFGTYDYRITSANYHDEVGKVTLDNVNDKKLISVNLRPAYGWIEVSGAGDLAGATVYVNNENVGLAPVKTRKLSSGSYHVRIVKDLFHVYTENVVVEDNQTTFLSPTLLGNFSTVTITTKPGAEIWIDGERKGVSTWSGRLPFGVYHMEAKMASHRSQSKTINIAEDEIIKNVQLPDPQPIYGSLSVEVLPDFADVYIDGVKVGTTPQMIREMLVGEYKVEVRKEGKASHEEQVVVREGELSSVRGELQDADLVFNVNGVQFKMIRVDGGEFMMGDNHKKAYYDEKPAHLVSLDSYYIGETEVTNALWVAVMGKGTIYYHNTLDNFPAIASWYECQEFIEKLNKLTGKQFRMPTEAEWEFAARGGNLSQGYKYSGSNKLSDVAWYRDNQAGKAFYPVASKLPNELGIYDMSGNEREWCNDYYDYDYYEESPKYNPQGPMSSKWGRVARGGECSSEAQDCKVSSRDYGEPSYVYSNSGLRLSLSLLKDESISQSEGVAVNSGGLTDEEKDDLNKLEFTVRGIQFSMIRVEGGEFMMGVNREETTYYEREKTHLVSLDSYYIGETEVTQELWEAVMGTNPFEDYSDRGSNKPVGNVSWYDCQRFIDKLNELTGKKFRLPTEAEWEFAARGGNRSQGYKYAGSNNLDDVGWYGDYKIHPVAQKRPNELGLYDMSGNMQEFCNDYYYDYYYKESPKHNPQGPTSGWGHVLRGGRYNAEPKECYVYSRDRDLSERYDWQGFRLALDLE